MLRALLYFLLLYIAVDSSLLLPFQLNLNAKALLLTCDKGACVIPYQLRSVTLLRAMNCRNAASPVKLMKKCEVSLFFSFGGFVCLFSFQLMPHHDGK